MLDTLPLDVDDDIFLFMFIENNSARIWEMYKLAPEKDLIVNDFGNWTEGIGLKLTNLEKWQRRGDLSVSLKAEILNQSNSILSKIASEHKWSYFLNVILR